MSTTLTGLQAMIDAAVDRVNERGLSFNPAQTVCMISGKNPFTSMPSWNIDASCLNIKPTIKYLGTVLGNVGAKRHVEQRISAANKAYYSLQAAGLTENSVQPNTAFHMYNRAVRSVLTFAKQDLKGLEKILGKHVKCTLGLPSSCHTSPILQASGIRSVIQGTQYATINLLKRCIYTTVQPCVPRYSCVFGKRNYRVLVRVSVCVCPCVCFCTITQKEVDLGTRNRNTL